MKFHKHDGFSIFFSLNNKNPKLSVLPKDHCNVYVQCTDSSKIYRFNGNHGHFDKKDRRSKSVPWKWENGKRQNLTKITRTASSLLCHLANCKQVWKFDKNIRFSWSSSLCLACQHYFLTQATSFNIWFAQFSRIHKALTKDDFFIFWKLIYHIICWHAWELCLSNNNR